MDGYDSRSSCLHWMWGGNSLYPFWWADGGANYPKIISIYARRYKQMLKQNVLTNAIFYNIEFIFFWYRVGGYVSVSGMQERRCTGNMFIRWSAEGTGDTEARWGETHWPWWNVVLYCPLMHTIDIAAEEPTLTCHMVRLLFLFWSTSR